MEATCAVVIYGFRVRMHVCGTFLPSLALTSHSGLPTRPFFMTTTCSQFLRDGCKERTSYPYSGVVMVDGSGGLSGNSRAVYS